MFRIHMLVHCIFGEINRCLNFSINKCYELNKDYQNKTFEWFVSALNGFIVCALQMLFLPQAMLDAARESINAPREAIRQKYLEAERKKQEELEAKEAASLSDQNSKSPKGRKSAKGKKSPANGKKKGK